MKCRLLIKQGGRWKIGLRTYDTVKEAQARRAELIGVGVKSQNIRIQTEEGIFN